MKEPVSNLVLTELVVASPAIVLFWFKSVNAMLCDSEVTDEVVAKANGKTEKV